MVNETFVEFGDVVVIGVYQRIKVYGKVASPYYGVVIGFTCNGNPRVYPFYYKQNIQSIGTKGLLKGSIIIPNAIPINRELLFKQGGNYEKNYFTILKEVKRHEQNKDKSLRARQQEKVDFSW